MSTADDRLKELGHELPPQARPMANYIASYRVGNVVYLSGVGPRRADGSRITGKLGRDLSVEQGYEAALHCGLNLLANLKEEIGDLDKVDHFVKLLGMVNSDPSFERTPEVINGCSDLFVAVFGDRGKHARSAVGMATLPMGIAVEIEAIVHVRE